MEVADADYTLLEVGMFKPGPSDFEAHKRMTGFQQ